MRGWGGSQLLPLGPQGLGSTWHQPTPAQGICDAQDPLGLGVLPLYFSKVHVTKYISKTPRFPWKLLLSDCIWLLSSLWVKQIMPANYFLHQMSVAASYQRLSTTRHRYITAVCSFSWVFPYWNSNFGVSVAWCKLLFEQCFMLPNGWVSSLLASRPHAVAVHVCSSDVGYHSVGLQKVVCTDCRGN